MSNNISCIIDWERYHEIRKTNFKIEETEIKDIEYYTNRRSKEILSKFLSGMKKHIDNLNNISIQVKRIRYD